MTRARQMKREREATDGASYKVTRKRVSSLKPSPENLKLYKLVEEDDSEIVKLAESIRKCGLHEPLVVTADGYIVSGHRRHAALLRIGQVVVTCRVLAVRRDSMNSDDYIALLRDHNRQRIKSVAEQVREELVDIDPEQALQNLRTLRDKSVHAAEYHDVPVLTIQGQKQRHGISEDKSEHVRFIQQVVFTDRKKYWPLSVRGVHYALLNYTFFRNTSLALPYENNPESYTRTADLITRLRLNGELPWEAFDDPTRPLTTFRPFSNVRQFVRHEVNSLFNGYWRNLLQSQPNHIECLCEKNTVYHMALSVTRRFQVPTSSGRGFNSIDPYYDLYQRYRQSGKERLIVITLTDFDPEGQMIPQVAGRTLRDDFGVDDFDIIPAGVTRKQIEDYELPPQNVAKETSSNHRWFVEQNDGDDTAYELEALDPEDMLRDLESVITSTLDMDLFNREAAAEQEDATYLQAVRKSASEALKGLLE